MNETLSTLVINILHDLLHEDLEVNRNIEYLRKKKRLNLQSHNRVFRNIHMFI